MVADHSSPLGGDERRYWTRTARTTTTPSWMKFALGVPHPPATAHQSGRGGGLDSAGRLEEVDRETRGHEVIETVALLESACDQADQSGAVQMIVTPMALRARRRKELIECDLGEVCRARGHPGIVAQGGLMARNAFSDCGSCLRWTAEDCKPAVGLKAHAESVSVIPDPARPRTHESATAAHASTHSLGAIASPEGELIASFVANWPTYDGGADRPGVLTGTVTGFPRQLLTIRQDVLMDVVSTTPLVMVVADDADVMTPTERGLRLSGFDMSSAKNGAEAVNGVEIEFTRLLHTVAGAGFVLRARE
jgi:hypothetical protein